MNKVEPQGQGIASKSQVWRDGQISALGIGDRGVSCVGVSQKVHGAKSNYGAPARRPRLSSQRFISLRSCTHAGISAETQTDQGFDSSAAPSTFSFIRATAILQPTRMQTHALTCIMKLVNRAREAWKYISNGSAIGLWLPQFSCNKLDWTANATH